MKNYRSLILNQLLDKYEKSTLFKETNKVKVQIVMPFNKKTLADYFDENNFGAYAEIKNICIDLENKGLIKIEWQNKLSKDTINKVVLNTDCKDIVYLEVARTPRKSFEEKAIECLKVYLNNNDWVDKFIDDQISAICKHEINTKYFNIGDLSEMEDIIKGVVNLSRQQVEIPKRQFSIRLYNNSKRFEILQAKIVKIVADYSSHGDGLTEEELLGELNVVKNPGFVYLKGKGVVSIQNSIVDLGELKGEIAFSSSIINEMNIDLSGVDSIITIENLTNFVHFKSDSQLVIYLGGYLNNVRKIFLKRIYSMYPKVQYYHFGDIDLGGFQILNHMKKETGINFKAYRMGSEELSLYKAYLKPISSSYLKAVNKAMQKPEFEEYRDCLELIAKMKGTLEQEIITEY